MAEHGTEFGDAAATAAALAAGRGDGTRALVREEMFSKGQSRRIWAELYKVRRRGAEGTGRGGAGERKRNRTQGGRRGALTRRLHQVIDSSDVVIQVLDARDPLGTRCYHLEQYLKRNCKHKHMLLLLNKCDLVSGPAPGPGPSAAPAPRPKMNFLYCPYHPSPSSGGGGGDAK